MKINIKATGFPITSAISDYVGKKVSSLEKFLGGASEILVNVEVGKTTKHHKSGDFFRAEIQIEANGNNYYASAEKDDLYAAIDEVRDEITRELTSRRKKATDLFRRGGAKIKSLIKGITSWKKRE